MRNLTIEDLYVAISWLECNDGNEEDGEHGEKQSCERAAKFLKRELVRRAMKSLKRRTQS